jgi:tetratricopeptide (TPR) repeat protein
MIGESDAVSLFVDRARSVRSDFALTADNAAAVAEMSIRLDGLPLAIELAAARLRVFSPRDLLDRLEKQFDVLGSGARDLPARQRTLQSTIEWSYQLLDPDECRMFQLMSVFSAARLESIEDVARTVYGDLDTIELVASLVDKSLVRSTLIAGSQRFSLLQTIREYSEARLELDPDDARAVRLAHARHFTDYAAGMRHRLDGVDAGDALTEMASELGNLRTAWDHWVGSRDLEEVRRLLESMWVLNDARGWYEGVIELMTDFLDVLGTVEPLPEALEEEMTVRTSLARALMASRGYTAEVEAEFGRVMALSEVAPTSVRRLQVLRALATYHLNLTDFARAAAIGREILDQAERDDDAAGMVEGHLVFGVTIAMAGELDLGLGHMKQAIDLFDAGRYPVSRFRGGASPGVVARNASALLLRLRGWPDQAVTRAKEGLALSRTLHHPFSLAYALHHMGLLALQGGRFEEAQSHAIELGALAHDNDWPVWHALASVVQGVAMCGLGSGAAGIALTEAGNELYRGLTTPPVFWPGLLGLRSLAFAMAGEPQRALALADEAIIAAGSDEAYFPDLRLVRGLCLAMLPESNATAVEDAYLAAIRGARIATDKMTELSATTRLVALRSAKALSPDGTDGLAQLYAEFTEGFDEPELIEARTVLSAIG